VPSDSEDSQIQDFVGCKECKTAISKVYYDARFIKKKFKADVMRSNKSRSRAYFNGISRLTSRCMELMENNMDHKTQANLVMALFKYGRSVSRSDIREQSIFGSFNKRISKGVMKNLDSLVS
jgi:hypothetical protein